MYIDRNHYYVLIYFLVLTKVLVLCSILLGWDIERIIVLMVACAGQSLLVAVFACMLGRPGQAILWFGFYGFWSAAALSV